MDSVSECDSSKLFLPLNDPKTSRSEILALVTPYDERGRRCPVCGKKFATTSEMTAHLRKEHSGISYEGK